MHKDLKILDHVDLLLDRLGEKTHTANDASASTIKLDIDILGGSQETEDLKKGFESMCIDSHLLKCDQNTLQKSICINIAYLIFSIEKYLVIFAL